MAVAGVAPWRHGRGTSKHATDMGGRPMDASTLGAGAHAGLIEWLRSNGIEYELHEHREAFTAQATARAEGVDPRTFAKVVVVRADDDRRAMVVLDAPDHLDMRKAREALGAKNVHLLSEEELAAMAPDCEVGAIPAVGSLFGLPVHADHAVRDDARISFNAGSHRHAVRVDRAAWERATGAEYADLAVDRDMRPAWARS
jgi:Ala-tRNA(Pro) deacylase